MAMIKALGLDGSLFHQFAIFVGNALHGDLGTSIRMRQPAVEAFFSRLPNTLAIIPWALLLAMCVGIPLGVIAALAHWKDADPIGLQQEVGRDLHQAEASPTPTPSPPAQRGEREGTRAPARGG